MLSNQHKREWDFFGLCGCPTSLVIIVMRVARLAAQYKRPASGSSASSSPEDCTESDVRTVVALAEIEQFLESWCHIPGPAALRDEDSMHQDLDALHCSEAWKNGLLLYIFRVFQWEPGTEIPMNILRRARAVVDHVVSCRDINMVSKQALLPLFFAGCELQDPSIQMKIINLCSVWHDSTRYHMFRDAIPLLEEVWLDQQTMGFENVWWGQVVDRRHASQAHSLQMRLCFG